MIDVTWGRISLLSAMVALCLSSVAFYKVSKMDAQLRASKSDWNSRTVSTRTISNRSELISDSRSGDQMANSDPVLRVETPTERFSSKSDT
jgi:hypothetical protein